MIKFKSILMTVASLCFLIGATSCEKSFIYDEGGDCSAKVQFIFKKHRHALNSIPGREADAFYSTVESVHLFVYNVDSGELVFEKSDKTDNLKSALELKIGEGTERCFLPVDLNPGRYRFIAWCGLDETDNNNAFNLSDGSTRADYKECIVKKSDITGHPVNNEKYEPIYHGISKIIEITRETGSIIIPVELTKDTNDIAVWVQHNSRTFTEGEYEVVYTDANGSMKFEDNSLSRNDKLEYKAHTTSILTSETEYNGTLVNAGALVAHISTSRLVDANKNDARLEVRTKDGRPVFSIPFIKYILQMQTLTSDSQYYLDCEDTYNCSFYITGEDDKWMAAQIIINNWVIVPDQNAEI